MNLLALVTSAKDLTLFNQPRTWVENHGINILIIIVGAWILRRVGLALITGILNQAFRSHPFAHESDRKKRIATLDSLLSAVSKILVWTVAVIMIVDELGINTAPLLASAGVVGVALGIGSQSLIKDFTNGLFIIIENQYRVGDYVQFGTITGVVQAITIRTTILRDMDGNIHHVPNSTISVATNKTFDISGINENITVSIDTDLDKLEKIIKKVGEELASDEKFGTKIKRPPYMAQVIGFVDRGIVVKILGDTNPGSQWQVRTALYKRLQKAFLANDIDLPLSPRASKTEKKTTK